MPNIEGIDELIAGIDKERAELDKKQKDLVLKKAKAEGRVVEKVSDLKCDVHGASKFVENVKRVEWREVKFYFCEECKKEGWMHVMVRKNSAAYVCPDCGIVVGIIKERRYDDIGFLCGSAGVEYYCDVCGYTLGRIAFTHA